MFDSVQAGGHGVAGSGAERGGARLRTWAAFALPVLLSLPAFGALCHPEFDGGPVFNVGNNAGTNALGDFDRDGNLDLTTGQAIMLGDGMGNFGALIPIPACPDTVFDVGVRDFDGDGILDMVLAAIHQDAIYVYFGREPTPGSPALFESPLVLPSISSLWHLVCPDLNNDGADDVVTVSSGVPTLAIHLNAGGRAFDPVRYQPMSIPGHALAAGDFDGDGNFDVAVGSGSNAELFFGAGDGAIRNRVTAQMTHQGSPVAMHRFRSGDLDQDGRWDLLGVGDTIVPIYLGRDIDPVAGLPPAPTQVYRLEGNGRFMEIADINGDGVLDLATQGAAATSVIRVFSGGMSGSAGGISFTPGRSFFTLLSGHGSVLAVGDVDNDGSPDLVVTTEDSNQGQVFLNDGNCFIVPADPGDANTDGIVNIADGIAILAYLFRGAELACPAAGELNGDDMLNIADVIYLLAYLFAGGPGLGPGPVDCRG